MLNKKITGVFAGLLLLSSATLGTVIATNTNQNVVKASIVKENNIPDESPIPVKVNYETLNRKVIKTTTYKEKTMYEDLILDSKEIPSGYRLATDAEMENANIDVDEAKFTYDGTMNLTDSFEDAPIRSVFIMPVPSNGRMGTIHVNYPAGYGIQIWTKSGKPVKYNAVEAKKTHHKVGSAKKLMGQTNWKVFTNTYKANGTTYYNLGGDQYIDANYVSLTLK
ncbi:SLAP domain-containing protein [Lacticaseibacillus zhaodongensis]|uniref:SLAP domain-containing protein n=1 Tax=Lacticaseibacillus zhaodongensis TaxID=2668065 RepID=UPI0012D322A8|nr:SLAP domain-containing protein [Lacticaseibacillus zhaodongensis]